jgi:hypothetical protein
MSIREDLLLFMPPPHGIAKEVHHREDTILHWQSRGRSGIYHEDL